MMPKAAFFTALFCALTPFARALPSGWTPQEEYTGLSSDEKKIYGITLRGPSAGAGPAAKLEAYYYAHDNVMDKTSAKFIRVHSSPVPKSGAAFPRALKAEGDKVGGLPAKLFSSVSSGRNTAHSLDAKRTELWESFAVIPAKRGYYVLRYSAAPDKYEAGFPLFEAFVSSFKPLLK